MEKKGLCITCVNEKRCVFLKNEPVILCEEFDDCVIEPEQAKEQLQNKAKHAIPAKK